MKQALPPVPHEPSAFGVRTRTAHNTRWLVFARAARAKPARSPNEHDRHSDPRPIRRSRHLPAVCDRTPPHSHRVPVRTRTTKPKGPPTGPAITRRPGPAATSPPASSPWQTAHAASSIMLRRSFSALRRLPGRGTYTLLDLKSARTLRYG